MQRETYDDLAVLKCFDYRCGYCFALLPVYADVQAYRTGTYSDADGALIVRAVCGMTRVYFGFHFDHIEPRMAGDAGGDEEWFELAPVCADCNRKKHRSSIPRWLFRQVDPDSKRRAAYHVEYQKTRRARDAQCEELASQDFEALLRASLAAPRAPEPPAPRASDVFALLR